MASEIKFTRMKVADISVDEKNPRYIKKKDFKDLVNSIRDFPDMLKIRPIVVDETNNNRVMGGSQRLRAVVELGWKHVDVVKAGTLSEDQKREFIIKDNVHSGQWNMEMLANEWDETKLKDWGAIKGFKGEDETEEGEIEFSEELDEESNYIVLKFDKDIDWLNLLSMLDIKSTYSMRQNGKPWSKGKGRVVDGMLAINKIKKARNDS